jgi:hypothetical protein
MSKTLNPSHTQPIVIHLKTKDKQNTEPFAHSTLCEVSYKEISPRADILNSVCRLTGKSFPGLMYSKCVLVRTIVSRQAWVSRGYLKLLYPVTKVEQDDVQQVRFGAYDRL